VCCRRWSERCARLSLYGGKDALANRLSVVRKDGSKETMRTGKTPGIVPLDAGEGFLVEVGGGGGFWDPLERDPARVLADVRSGYVSVKAAQRGYGVVIRVDGRRFELDLEATAALRKSALTTKIA
jgi:N-methylhydantoinase B